MEETLKQRYSDMRAVAKDEIFGEISAEIFKMKFVTALRDRAARFQCMSWTSLAAVSYSNIRIMRVQCSYS